MPLPSFSAAILKSNKGITTGISGPKLSGNTRRNDSINAAHSSRSARVRIRLYREGI
jgi:hypothetical protein